MVRSANTRVVDRRCHLLARSRLPRTTVAVSCLTGLRGDGRGDRGLVHGRAARPGRPERPERGPPVLGRLPQGSHQARPEGGPSRDLRCPRGLRQAIAKGAVRHHVAAVSGPLHAQPALDRPERCARHRGRGRALDLLPARSCLSHDPAPRRRSDARTEVPAGPPSCSRTPRRTCWPTCTFPREHRRCLHSTNPIERLHKEVKRHTRVVGIFPTSDSLMRMVGTLLAEQDDGGRSPTAVTSASARWPRSTSSKEVRTEGATRRNRLRSEDGGDETQPLDGKRPPSGPRSGTGVKLMRDAGPV
jgi:hypothetical protein